MATSDLSIGQRQQSRNESEVIELGNYYKLEMVDVFLLTADNTDITDLVRLCWHPPVRELGEVDEKYIIQNSWGLIIPLA